MSKAYDMGYQEKAIIGKDFVGSPTFMRRFTVSLNGFERMTDEYVLPLRLVDTPAASTLATQGWQDAGFWYHVDSFGVDDMTYLESLGLYMTSLNLHTLPRERRHRDVGTNVRFGVSRLLDNTARIMLYPMVNDEIYEYMEQAEAPRLFASVDGVGRRTLAVTDRYNVMEAGPDFYDTLHLKTKPNLVDDAHWQTLYAALGHLTAQAVDVLGHELNPSHLASNPQLADIE